MFVVISCDLYRFLVDHNNGSIVSICKISSVATTIRIIKTTVPTCVFNLYLYQHHQLAFLPPIVLHTQLTKMSALHTRLYILCFFFGIQARKKGFSASPAEPRNR